jgi:hypothetical protein
MQSARISNSSKHYLNLAGFVAKVQGYHAFWTKLQIDIIHLKKGGTKAH